MRPFVFHELGDAAIRGHDLEHVSFAPEEISPISAAELVRVLDDDIENRLKIERRSADALEDLSRRCLLLERLLCLVEKADVLDRDGRLMSERLEQSDLVLRERSRRASPARDDDADDLLLAQERNPQHRRLHLANSPP